MSNSIFYPGKSYLLLLLILLFSCSPKVVDFVNTRSNFNGYGSYLVVNFKANQTDISEEGRKILSEIEQNIHLEMNRRSYRPLNANPDLVVRYELISNQAIKTQQNNYGYSPYSTFPSQNYVTVRAVLESALLIEITDVKTKKLVWQASVDMDKYTRKSKQEEIIKDAVTNLFDTYLYRANSNAPDESLISAK
ncbi:DUF4136 domain-containing protein [Marinoscillum sp.]|uniref:DUF4136 domain-containing protein n=1 Tax=Marinoscillum sp. TaxID=2024838 RepID=UPI003BAD33C1